ncbi:septum formation initiator family protein [Collinsella sp. D33t1_170424_A12]|uniref:FtsB family cell division protein n=1 Tax=Collinsella sp. D33t1_170424_A12 TaxID=2787135 RepID=UPI001E5CB367|nr:septum formation initiator family protein [Collinsella sp. D33t1_170424_A12]
MRTSTNNRGGFSVYQSARDAGRASRPDDREADGRMPRSGAGSTAVPRGPRTVQLTSARRPVTGVPYARDAYDGGRSHREGDYARAAGADRAEAADRAPRGASGARRTPDRAGAADRAPRGAAGARRTPDRAGAGRSRGASRSGRPAATPMAERVAARAASRRRSEAQRNNLMKYAGDNAFVQLVYDIVAGRFRFVFYAAVAAVILVSLYGPVADLYAAHRTNAILQEQQAIGQRYTDDLQGQVDKLLSKEGIESAAREQGMAKPGEQPIIIEGLPDDGEDSGIPGSASDVERAQREVLDKALNEAPWYYEVLDSLLGYTGPVGQVPSAPSE